MFNYLLLCDYLMKGRTKCPKCNHDFILDIPNDKEKYSTTCPSCNYKFNIKKPIECEDTEEECIWEEHGEPRKTILSSMKPRTDKPMITSFILIIVFIINLISAISIQLDSKIFIDSTFGFLITFNLNISEFLFYLLRYAVSRLLSAEDKLQRVKEEIDILKAQKGL